MADNQPLLRLISRYVDADLLDEIAEQYNNGRLLLIGTTNLDARRPVIWNMGAIASSGTEQGLILFRKIILASAAIPGAFPPMFIDVEVDRQPHQEMHVDGGAMAQVFLYPPALNLRERSDELGIVRERHAYIIRNASLAPDWTTVERQTISIANRAISSLIHTQGIGDLYRLYVTTQRDGVDYNLAYVGRDFQVKHKEDFDPVYMQALFDYAYQQARKGYGWQKAPPGWQDTSALR